MPPGFLAPLKNTSPPHTSAGYLPPCLPLQSSPTPFRAIGQTHDSAAPKLARMGHHCFRHTIPDTQRESVGSKGATQSVRSPWFQRAVSPAARCARGAGRAPHTRFRYHSCQGSGVESATRRAPPSWLRPHGPSPITRPR